MTKYEIGAALGLVLILSVLSVLASTWIGIYIDVSFGM